MNLTVSRRVFLKASAAGLATFAIGRAGFAANSKLNHACIGVGGMGFNDLKQFKDHTKVQIVAICDVDKNLLAKAAALVPGARQYTDWRELFAKEGPRIDSVNIAVPDHMHAPITVTALHCRRHVYCQKPLCHDVAECRAVARAAQAADVVTQLGTQFASGIGDRMAVQ
jgi:predicted dehydrogenase